MTISCKSILDEVAKATAYLGAKRGEYERLSTTDANAEILSRYWREAVAEAAVELGPAAEFALSESVESVEVTLDSAIDPTLAESLLRAFLIDRVTARWLALAGVDHANAGAGTAILQIISFKAQNLRLERSLSPF